MHETPIEKDGLDPMPSKVVKLLKLIAIIDSECPMGSRFRSTELFRDRIVCIGHPPPAGHILAVHWLL